MNYTPLSHKAKPVLFITAVLQALLTGGALCAGIYLLPIYGYGMLQSLRIWLCAGVALLAALWAIISPIVRFRRYRYCIADDRIEIVEGIVYIRRTMVPIDRIHQIDIVRGPVDNRFGLAKVTVTTAGATATMRFLELEKAESICEMLNTVITQKLRSAKGDSHV